MTRLVTFAVPMGRHGVGDTRLVPDAVAARLDDEGALSASQSWPDNPYDVPAAQRPQRPVIKTRRPVARF